MDVAVSTLRAELSSWLDRVKAGEEVVVTERGIPVVRMLPVATASHIEQLVRAGVLSPAMARSPANSFARVRGHGSVADLISEQRR